MLPLSRPSDRVVSSGVSLKDRIAALQQRTGSTSPPNLSPPTKVAVSSIPGPGALRDKIARFEVKGGVPVPRGSFGLGAPPVREDATARRKGELFFGNRIASTGRYIPLSDSKNEGGVPSLSSDGSLVQRKRCISTSVLSNYVVDATPTITRSDSSSSSVSNPIDGREVDTDANDTPSILESPSQRLRRNSVSDVDAKRASLLADDSCSKEAQSILFPPRDPKTPPSPSRTITQEISDSAVTADTIVPTNVAHSVAEVKEELISHLKEEGVDEDEAVDQEDVDQDILVSSDAAIDEEDEVLSSEDVSNFSVTELVEEELSCPTVASEPANSEPSTAAEPSTCPDHEHESEQTGLDCRDDDRLEQSPSLSPSHSLLSSPSQPAEELSSHSRDETPQPPSPAKDISLNSDLSLVEKDDPPSNVEPEKSEGVCRPIVQVSQSMPAIVFSSDASSTLQNGTAQNDGTSPLTRSSSLHLSRSPSMGASPTIPEGTYTELALEPKTGPKSFKAVVHGRKTHNKQPAPVDHRVQVVAPLNLRKGRSLSSATRSQHVGSVRSPPTPNSPDLSLLVAQAAQLEQRLSGEPEKAIHEESEGVQEIVIVQEVIVEQKSPNLGVDEFGQGPPISPSLQSLISNSSNDSKRRRTKSQRSLKGRLPAIDDNGVPPTPPPKSAQWFKTLPSSILSRNHSSTSNDRYSRESWSSEKSSEDSSAITTPPSPTFDLVTLPLAEDQLHHPGYRLGGRRSSSISSSSILSSPKKSPSKKRSSTFVGRMFARAGKSSSTLALPDDSGSISDLPRAPSPSPSYFSTSKSETGLSSFSPQLAARLPSRPASTISTSSPASVLSTTIFDAFPEVPNEAPTPPPKSPLHFRNDIHPASVSRSLSSVSHAGKRGQSPELPDSTWYDEENGVHHSLVL